MPGGGGRTAVPVADGFEDESHDDESVTRPRIHLRKRAKVAWKGTGNSRKREYHVCGMLTSVANRNCKLKLLNKE